MRQCAGWAKPTSPAFGRPDEMRAHVCLNRASRVGTTRSARLCPPYDTLPPAPQRIVRGVAEADAALLGAVHRPFAVMVAGAGRGQVAVESRVLRPLLTVDETRHVPGLLFGERVAQAIGHVGADEI